ncbi:MAG: hypothetical protein HDQ96_14760 [Lachnospiraceae bacterium]|nr:hypothetical protein [Lachnospiraceae bacterium]
MLLTENSYNYAGIDLRGSGNAAGKDKASSRVYRGNDFLDNISRASQRMAEKSEGSRRETAGTSGNVSAQEEFAKNQSTTGEFIDEVAKDGKELSRDDLLNIIAEHREEILKKLKNGETGVKIAIGSMELTEEEWEKLLDSFDEAQEEIQKNVREKSGKELPEKRPDTTINGNKVLAPEDTGHDLKSLEELGSAGVKRAEGFADFFPEMQVITKVGNCNVSSGMWCRTDFPFWEYFKKGTSADALNDWQPSGPQPGMLDPKIQRNLSSIGPGKISILIPDKLQAKMDADPAYAEEIYRKVAKWKEDYDAWDNATAASLGMNVAEHQMSKSYCVQLDEDGNVGNFTVVSGGGEITQSEKTVEDNWLKRRNAAILFHKRHLAKMGYTGLTGTAGIVTEAGEESPLSLLRAELTAGMLLADRDNKKDNK